MICGDYGGLGGCGGGGALLPPLARNGGGFMLRSLAKMYTFLL